MPKNQAAEADPPKEPEAQTSPSPEAGESGSKQLEGQTPPQEGLTDDQIWEALRDPRAQAVIEHFGGQRIEPEAKVPADTPRVESKPSEFMDELEKLAESGDVEALQKRIQDEKTQAADSRRLELERSKGAEETRKQMYLNAAQELEKEQLTPSQSLKLVQALSQGDQVFFPAVVDVLAEIKSSRAQGDVAAGQREDQIATKNQALGQDQQSRTPGLPEGTPSSPQPDLGIDGKKTGYDVLKEAFAWERENENVIPNI